MKIVQRFRVFELVLFLLSKGLYQRINEGYLVDGGYESNYGVECDNEVLF